MNSLNISKENKENKLNNTEIQENEIKEKIISILQSKKLVGMLDEININSLQDIQNHMLKLFKTNQITKDDFFQIGYNSGAYTLGMYLVRIGAITDENLEMAFKMMKVYNNTKSIGEILVITKVLTIKELNKHKEEAGMKKLGDYLKENTNITDKEINHALKVKKEREDNGEEKNIFLGQILVEEEIIEPEELNSTLQKIGIIRLGEYIVLKKGLITYEQLEKYLKYQKTFKKPLGEIIVEDKHNNITQSLINSIYKELGIELTSNDLELIENNEIMLEGTGEHIFVTKKIKDNL